jgi:hypothetical protein
MNKTFREIKKQYVWPNMKRDIERYVKKSDEQEFGPEAWSPDGNHDNREETI